MPFVPPMTDWMKHITNPFLQLSALSIPGTHSSASMSLDPFVGTQSLTIREQLDQGIRFLDLRITLKRAHPRGDPHLVLVHGSHSLGLKLESLLNDIYNWLDDHDQEALIVQIKHDGTLDPHFTFDQFNQAVFDLLRQQPDHWRFDATIPMLTQLRGRIQLLRRIGLPATQPLASAGLDVTAWLDNCHTPFDIAATPGLATQNVRVQDRYRYAYADGSPWLTIPDKFRLVERVMKEAAVAAPWFFNYTDAVSPETSTDPIEYAQGYFDDDRERYCDGVNKRMVGYLATLPAETRCGTLVMDFPEGKHSTSLISAIVQMNDLTP